MIINEFIFIIQLTAVASITALSTRWGKEGITAITVLWAVLANLLITKQIMLCSLHVTATDTLGIGCGLALNILQEYYGFSAAKRALFVSFSGLITCALLIQIHLWYIPAPGDVQHVHFCALFAAMPRIVLASLGSYLVAQYIDCKIYQLLRQQFTNMPRILRNYGSLTVSQLIDTILFSLFGLWGIMPHISHIIVMSYAIKLITTIFIVPLTLRLTNGITSLPKSSRTG